MASGFQVTVDLSGIEKKLMQDFGPGGEAQRLWSEIVFYGSVPYMPKVTGNFVNLSIAASTQLFKFGELLYPGPFAHYLWNGIVYVDPMTGSAWARRGATKIPTDREIQFSRETNSLATAQWVVVAKNDHLQEWINTFERAVNEGIV